MLEGSKSTQQVQLLGPEAGDLDKALRASEHRDQAQQQDLIERIDHLAALPRTLKILKMIRTNNRLIQRTRRIHDSLHQPNQRLLLDSTL